MSFLGELKRRRVVRVALVYGAVAYAVVQAADVFVPALHLPPWILTATALVAALGLPIALVLAWAFELTPEGVRRTEALAPEVPGARSANWLSGRAIGAATGLVVAGATIGWLAGARRAPAAGETSIAVLPFSNLARNQDAEPFVEGIHDDLLTQLSGIQALKVISRTSVQEYRETRKNIRQIGEELGVAYILEGGVQRAGDAVRINVQLIDARTDEHLWANTYDGDLSVAGIFDLQAEIASAITSALRARLTSAECTALPRHPTESLAAYDHVQRGAASFRRSQVPEDVRAAAAEFEAAVQVDPRYADAWARLAIARLTLSWEWGQTEQLEAAEAAVRRAEELAPEAKLTYLARGYFEYYGRRDYQQALRILERAEALAPGDPEVLNPIAWVYRRLGRYDDAVRHFEQALERDPRNYETLITYAYTCVTLRRWDQAERLGNLLVSNDPGIEGAYQLLALLPLLRSGDTTAAATAILRGGALVEFRYALFGWPPLARTLAARFAGDIRAATSALANDSVGFMVQWQTSGLTPAAYFLQKAEALRVLGDALGAVAHFDSARMVLEPQVRAREGSIWNYQGDLPTALGVALAGLGRKEEAIRYGRMGVASLERAADHYMIPRTHAQLAEIYLVTGEPERALDELERASRATGLFAGRSLAVDPLWAPLASHPRFRALVAGR